MNSSNITGPSLGECSVEFVGNIQGLEQAAARAKSVVQSIKYDVDRLATPSDKVEQEQRKVADKTMRWLAEQAAKRRQLLVDHQNQQIDSNLDESDLPKLMGNANAEAERGRLAQDKFRSSIGSLNEALKQKADALKGATSGVVSLLGVVGRFAGVAGIVVGAVGGMVAAIKSSVDWFYKSERAAERAAASLQEVKKAYEKVGEGPTTQLQQKIDELYRIFEEDSKKIKEDEDLDSKDRYVRQYRSLVSLQESIKKVKEDAANQDKQREQEVADKAKEAQSKAFADRRQQIKELTDAAVLENLEGLDRIAEEQKRFDAEVAEARKSSNRIDYQEELTRYEEAVTAGFEKRRQLFLDNQAKEKAAEDERRQEAERREKESAERIARNYEDAMRQANERISAQAQQLNPINSQVLNTLIGIKDTLDAIGSQRDRRAL